MKSYVITILDNEKSVQAAQRCIDSGRKFGIDIEMWPATTPTNTDVLVAANAQGININGFKEKYSRLENCVAAFMSHLSLWRQCQVLGEEFQIFEHDAVVVSRIPEFINYVGCINLGKPSYGRYNDPLRLGVNPLTSKRYFPGAHAYRLKPVAAKQLIDAVPMFSCPTDIYLRLDVFPWLEEYYPWPVEAMDTFTTIQKEEGCKAKHNFKAGYEII